MERMSIDRRRSAWHGDAIFVAVCLFAVGATLWASGMAADPVRAVSAPEAVLVSTSLLDMSRLEPAQFGDWEIASLRAN